MERRVIAALDLGNIDDAITVTKRLVPHVGAFKVGHALTLNYGLSVIDRLQEAGAQRIFLDLKFHDIPNSVALAVREAAKHGVWMMTVHISGGPAMMAAAVEEARMAEENERPLIVGVSALTSLDQHVLTDHLGIQRSITDHMCYLSQLAVDCGLDGVVTSPQEVTAVRNAVGHTGLVVTTGIRMPGTGVQDQVRVGTARQAVECGSNYLVIGRSLVERADPEVALRQFDLPSVPSGYAL